jgi:hypothetical protein
MAEFEKGGEEGGRDTENLSGLEFRSSSYFLLDWLISLLAVVNTEETGSTLTHVHKYPPPPKKKCPSHHPPAAISWYTHNGGFWGHLIKQAFAMLSILREEQGTLSLEREVGGGRGGRGREGRKGEGGEEGGGRGGRGREGE